MILYHGSGSMVTEPTTNLRKTADDFGPGFYLTDDRELASEWACSGNGSGYVNGYRIDTSDLDILDLDTTDDSILQWLSLLLQNRTIVPSTITMKEGMKYIQRHHSIDTDQYDVIRGCRAEGSIFSIARAFLSNQISLERLSSVIGSEDAGRQFVLKSPKALNRIEFIGFEEVDHDIHHSRYLERDRRLRTGLQDNDWDGTFIRDIVREGGIDGFLRRDIPG